MINFNERHPERQPDEFWITNVDAHTITAFATACCFHTLRKGVQAFDEHGHPIRFSIPLFAKKEDLKFSVEHHVYTMKEGAIVGF